MKIARLHIFFILISFSAQSQDLKSIPWEGRLPVVSPLYEQLKIKDTTALILALEYKSYWSKGTLKEFLVFFRNREIKLIKEFKPIDKSRKVKIKKKRIKGEINSEMWSFLDSCLTNNLFEIDQKELQKISKPAENGKTSTMIVNDGPLYSIALIAGRNFSNSYAYAPKSYIESGYPGIEDRRKFLIIIEGFYRIINTVGNNG